MIAAKRLTIVSATILMAALLAPPSFAARLHRPALQSPGNGATVSSLPTFQWSPVARAASYQFELAADARFGAIVSHGSISTYNTAATVDKAVPGGIYYWRVRAVTAKDAAGPWSQIRRLVKAWTTAPQQLAPTNTTVSWPSQPLVFSWSPVRYAVKYLLTVGTDSSLGNQVIGSASNPVITQGTRFTPGTSLTPGTYFWAVTPLDSEGHKGARSQIASFNYVWPTTTTTTMRDLDPSGGAGVFDPLFSWAPIPGAARYEVEVNAASDFPPGSKWCCATTTLGTSFSPTQVLGNNISYYWRVRAIAENGTAGVWNVWNGDLPFNEAFDNVTPTIPNLAVVDAHGNPLPNSALTPASTDTPIVTWSPVPGAARYEVQIVPYNGGNPVHCDWSLVALHPREFEAETATTAWTPLGDPTDAHIGPTAWPNAQWQFPALSTGTEYCLRVLARSDNDAKLNQVISDWTQINGPNAPAFNYASPPVPGTASDPFVTPNGDPILPSGGAIAPATPLFTWARVPGAQGYYVVISRDAGFTSIADIGFTNVPAYAPQLANSAPLADQTTAYYWAVIPAENGNGSGLSPYQPCSETTQPCNAFQTFNEQSIPPALLGPAPGANVNTQPTFMWTQARNAKNYTLQVSADPSFGSPIDNATIDSTAYTSNSTYPANRTLYWRVRANDWNNQGLNWSETRTFVRTLPVPVPSAGNATSGEDIPVLNWAPVQGATGYDIHIDWVDGTTSNYTVKAAAFTPIVWNGVGVWRWEVRADFPGPFGITSATSGYSAAQVFVRLLNAPSGAGGMKTRKRILIWWNPSNAAKNYEVDVSSTDGFATLIDSHRTENTSWAPEINLNTPQTRGKLYWRVAAVDSSGNVGTFATGSFGHNPPKHRHKKKRHRKRK